MKAICLIDDISNNPTLKKEHGVSIYFEINNHKYLLDCGQSRKFMDNAKKLNIDLTQVDRVFISHNHYDHINGLKHFLAHNQKAKVYLRDDALYDYYANFKGVKFPVSCKNNALKKYRHRIIPVEYEYNIDNLYVMTDQIGDQGFFCQDDDLLMRVNGKYVKDQFTHELFLAVCKQDKVHVISSCSHRGIVNILRTAKQRFNLPIGTVYAGLHMSKNRGKEMNCSKEYFNSVCDAIDKIGFEKLYTCHCTGWFAYEQLKKRFDNKVQYISTGQDAVFE